MLLLLAIVQSEDAPTLTDRLMQEGMRITRINSAGGLFGSGNVALLLGIDDERYDEVLAIIHATCKTRTKYVSAAPSPDSSLIYMFPIEVEVGGAVVFCLPVRRYVRLQGGSAPPALDINYQAVDPASTPQVASTTEGESHAMKLIIAIVQSEETDAVIGALLAGGHRLTRINSTGGFFRRGNATLLIGVEPQEVDDVINLIQSSCRRRTEPAALDKGIPAYAATVFVLDAPRTIRI